MRHNFVILLCVLLSGSLRAESAAPVIDIEVTEVPEMKDWAQNLQKELLAFYPVLEEKLGKDNVRRDIKIAVKKDVKGSGHTQGFNIVLGAEHFKNKPKDTGTAVFYLTRIMQSYKAKNAPSWLVTGIADYIRWWNFEPIERRRSINPREAKYTNGFNDAAAFLVWIEKTHDKDAVRKLNEALYTDTYSNDFFKKLAGKEPPELWNDFIVSTQREADQAARSAIDPAISKPMPKEAAVKFAEIGVVEFAQPESGLTIRYTLDGSFPTPKSYAYCAPLKIASSLKLRAVTYNKEGKCSDVVEVACICTPPEKNDEKIQLKAAINVDFSEAPDLEDWALKAQKESEDYFSVIADKLRSEGFTPPRQITYIFTEDREGLGPGVPAYAIASEGKIFFRAGHIRSSPNDFGMAIHELTHIIQFYSYGKNSPSWLVEGIADYIRWEHWEKPSARRRINPLKAKYTNGYSDTARFLSWIETNHDKDFVLKANAALRKNAYNEDLFKSCTGKELSELFKEFVDSLPK
jgi:hypothetical protein